MITLPGRTGRQDAEGRRGKAQKDGYIWQKDSNYYAKSGNSLTLV